MSDLETANTGGCHTSETEEEVAVFDISDTLIYKLQKIAIITDQPLESLISGILDAAVEEWQRENGVIDIPDCF